MDVSELQARIEALVADPSNIKGKKGKAVDEVIAALDEGQLRVAEFDGESWITHAWIKHAILLYFARMDSEHVGPDCAQKDAPGVREYSPTYFDKVPTKRNYKKLGVRCVPGGIARYGSFLGRGAIQNAQGESSKPSIILIHSTIGYASPKAGTFGAHGEPLGADNVTKTKEALGWPVEPAFLVPDDVAAYFAELQIGRRRGAREVGRGLHRLEARQRGFGQTVRARPRR